MTHSFQHAPNLAVPSLGNGHAVPAIGTLTTTILNGPENRHTVIQLHTLQQPRFFFVAERTQHPNGVLPLQTKTGMHQFVGEFTGAGEQKQALSIQIQTPHRLPLALL